MKSIVHLFEVRISHMGINLSRADITVPEHALHAADIGTVHQKVRRKTMTHRMWADVLGNPSEFRILANHSLDTTR